jgi:hypothetical protein
VRSSHSPDQLTVTFDDDHAVADAGLILAASLAEGLGLRELFDAHIDLGDASGAANAGDKAMTLLHSALAGGEWIGDADALRAGATGQVLGHRVAAPSTLGTFLRSFTWGSTRQLDQVAGIALARAWAAGAGPGPWPVTIDVDSTHCETYGLQKQGATGIDRHGERGYHPLLATVASSGDVLHSRLREGIANTGRGAASFVTETINRARRDGATGPICLRADSGFYTHKVVQACHKQGVTCSITVKLTKAVHKVIARIPTDVDADSLLAGRRRRRRRDQLPAVRPQRADDAADRAPRAAHPRLAARVVLRLRLSRLCHRPPGRHAGVGGRPPPPRRGRKHHPRPQVRRRPQPSPSGKFAANAAWLTLAVIAHNLARWTSRIGLGETLITTKTLRTRYLNLPGRLTRSARRWHLHLPTRWPWAQRFLLALDRLRCVPFPT